MREIRIGWALALLIMLAVGAGAQEPGAWTAAASLRSTDDPWQGLENILVSGPFDGGGEVRIALDMPDAGPVDGVIVMIVPADRATDGSSLLGALRDGVTVILMGSVPHQEVAGLSGECVVVQSVPTAKPWSLQVQTRP